MQNASALAPLIVTLSNGQWSATPTPPPPTSFSTLQGVSCSDSADCVAVGYSQTATTGPATFIETLSNGTWSVTPSPSPGTIETVLNGVSCSSSTGCVAVGFEVTDSSVVTLIETLSGSTWSVTPSPTAGTYGSDLFGVSCSSATACVAVGFENNGNAYPLMETLSGGNWSLTATPDPLGTGNDRADLSGVSCATGRDCVAVGFVGNGSSASTLVETLSEQGWTITPSPNKAASNQLNGVSCAAPGLCTAVGSYYSGDVGRTLVEKS